MALRFLVIAAATALLAAIAICSLTSSPNMREMWWIPGWLGEWADRHSYFRNFPPFAALAALLFFVADLFRPTTANCLLNTSAPASTSHFQWRRALVCFIAVALLGTALEYLQQLVPVRASYAHSEQIFWSVAGALVGAFTAAFTSMLFSRLRD